jgi:hypothetical protein
MHSAPSVTYPVERSRTAAALVGLVWLAGAFAAVQWTLQPGAAPARLGAAWTAVLATGSIAARRWWGGPRGLLAWDGTSWTWTSAGQAMAHGGLQVSLDLQRVLLVRWRGEAASRWLWLERASRPEQWDDLRRAVYSRARPEALPLAEPPAAKP